MKQKKLVNLLLVAALSASMLTACGSTAADTQPAADQTADTEATDTETTDTDATDTGAENPETDAEDTDADNADADAQTEAADENEAAAGQLLKDLTGTYQELWPVILDDQYTQIWLDDCEKLVGAENAQAAYDKLASMVTGEVYGEEAVKAYADGGGAYDCAFTQDVYTLEFDGDASAIKGYDADGNELFSHTYHYVGMEDVRGLYEYESDDADSGEFTYFCIAPDTTATTYHIELRYGSDLDALGQYDAGAYAYWLGSGISTDYDQEMVENCIELFCNENLSE